VDLSSVWYSSWSGW